MDEGTRKFYWDVGEKIRAVRLQRHFNVEKLAEMSEISTKYLYQIENGRVKFSTEIFYKISKSLNVSPTALLPEENTNDDLVKALFSEIIGKFSEKEKKYIRKMILTNM